MSQMSLQIDVVTLFPEMFPGVLNHSILGRAQKEGYVQFRIVDFRQFSNNKHHTVDDTPYGGGGGMVLKPEPIFHAVESLITGQRKPRIILMCPQGEVFNHAKAKEFAEEEHLILICGHYEGYDERIREHLVTDEISLGDFVLTGGEIPAMAVIDAVVRLIPGVLGNATSAKNDSFAEGLLEYPHYTRPVEFRGWKVPDVLLSGNHAEIAKWRRRKALERTLHRRPDLLKNVTLTLEEQAWLEELRAKMERPL
jgi:tRNA (guanine37-N1)-methyltransferase